MRLDRTGNIVFCSAAEQDRDTIREIAQMVYACYRREGPDWDVPRSDEIWPVSLGGRAGVVGVRLSGRVACAKLFYDERSRTKLRVVLGWSKGRRAYRNGLRLAEAGVGCPRMLGYAERRPAGPAMIVTELADDAERLDRWAAEHVVSADAVVALARFIRDLHDKGISHADLSPRNILIRRSGPPFEFLLLDYEDARFTTKLSARRRIADLHHLHERVVGYVPLRMRLRFLRAYASQDYRSLRDALRTMIEASGFRWLRDHVGPNTTSIPSQGTK